MPLYPGILLLPFSDACKGQWSVLSLQTESGGTKLWGTLLFFSTTTACEGLLDFEVQQWGMGNRGDLGLAVSSVKQPRLYQGQVKHVEYNVVVQFLGPDLGAIEGD
ncbi:hypothetical protein AMECASPLE_010769 [Ameca splendens]|uniref:Uncharacterized protein n=1 Tax=Ameca splendens TaxID=208324 RepID=A0ABV1A6X7_9TELE